jgi:hypothetical protein
MNYLFLHKKETEISGNSVVGQSNYVIPLIAGSKEHREILRFTRNDIASLLCFHHLKPC